MTTLGCANRPAHHLPSRGNEPWWSWSPTRSNRAARAGAPRCLQARHLQAPGRNKRSLAGPSPRANRCHCESERQRFHYRSDRSTSLAHRVPRPSTRPDAPCAAGEIRGERVANHFILQHPRVPRAGQPQHPFATTCGFVDRLHSYPRPLTQVVFACGSSSVEIRPPGRKANCLSG